MLKKESFNYMHEKKIPIKIMKYSLVSWVFGKHNAEIIYLNAQTNWYNFIKRQPYLIFKQIHAILLRFL